MQHTNQAKASSERTEISRVRSLYPVTDDWAYFNHASVSPISRRSSEVLKSWADDVAANACLNETRWAPRVERCRRQVASLINASADEVAFVSNTTEGISRVANGYPWRPGDVVLVPSDEYVSNALPWSALAHRGVTARRIPVTDSGVRLHDVQRSMCDKTRMVALSAVNFATGFRCDLRSIGIFCQQHGVHVCVDAVQAVGVTPIDVLEMRISFLVAGGHKWLTGPQGTGILYVKGEFQSMLSPSTPGWRSIHDAESECPTFLGNARRFESGTLDVGGLLALGEGVNIITELGVNAIVWQVHDVSAYLVEKLRSLEAQVFSRRDGDSWSGIVSFLVPGIHPKDVRAACLNDGVVLGLRKGRLRASVHFYNSMHDVNRLVEAVDKARPRNC